MLRDLAKVDAFLDGVFSRTEGPVSVKTRLGVEKPEEFAAILEIYSRYPISELTIHPRVMRQQYRGQADRAAFAAAYEKKHELVALQPEQAGKEQAKSPAKAKANARELRVLEIGENNWPFPVPLVREPKSGRWFFDTASGMQELLDRRIGNNELSAIQVCLAYVDAQNDYYRRNPEKAPIAHFAQKITSSPGKRDVLYWLPKEGEEKSPLGSLAASAEDKGKAAPAQSQSGGGAYHGYRYRILTAQGANAVHGAYNYVENGLMFGGFALLAYPETYGVTGVMSFMVNQDGTVFEKNLGKSTASLAKRITVFNPDRSWAKVKAD